MQLFHRTSAVFFALGLFIALCSSCSSEKKDPAADGSDAAEPFLALDFILESSEGFAPVEGSTIRLSFREGDTSELGFALHGGCNSLLGDFTLADGVMSVSQLMMTEMACGGGLMEQDNWKESISEDFDLSELVSIFSDFENSLKIRLGC